jgi:hypothetical protein
MKKICIAIVCMMCAVTMGFAQGNITLMRDNLCKPRVLPWLVSASLEGSGDQHYIYNEDFYEDAPKHQNADGVLCVDKSGNGLSEIRITHPDDYHFVKFYEGKDDLYAIYSIYDRKSKTYALYLNTIGKEQQRAPWDPRKLFSVVSEKRDDIFSFVSVSPDGSKAAISVILATRKGNMKGSFVTVLGEGGEQLWENSFDPEFSNPKFFIADMELSNAGEVYIAAVSYVNETRKSRDNETFHLYKITDNNLQFVDQKVDFGYISNGKLLIRRNGTVAFGGYFCNSLSEKAQGYYMMVCSGDAGEVSNVSYQKFPAEYYGEPKLTLGALKGEKMSVFVEDLYEFSDGSLVMLGEQRETLVRTVTSGNGMTTTYYTYHAKNILTSFADESGNLSDFKMIRKYQMAGSFIRPMGIKQLRGYGYSFRSFMHNDKLNILFADILDNYSGKVDVICKSSSASKHCSALCTIDSKHNVSKPEMIISPKVHKTRMVSPLFIDDDGLLLINASKKAGQLSKFSYSF